MVLVDSEAVAEIRYDPASSTMQVRFVDGDWYTYFGVPPEVHRGFLAATSHGRFCHDHIRDRYRYRRDR